MNRDYWILAGLILGAAVLYRRHRMEQDAAYNSLSSVMASRL